MKDVFSNKNMAQHNDTGLIGESEAAKFLITQGWEIVARNVRFKYGELDIVAREKIRAGYMYHFVEVKTVARGKYDSKVYHPMQNVTREKVKRLRRAVQGFIFKCPEVKIWQFDILCVYADVARGKYEFEVFKNQIL